MFSEYVAFNIKVKITKSVTFSSFSLRVAWCTLKKCNRGGSRNTFGGRSGIFFTKKNAEIGFDFSNAYSKNLLNDPILCRMHTCSASNDVCSANIGSFTWRRGRYKLIPENCLFLPPAPQLLDKRGFEK